MSTTDPERTPFAPLVIVRPTTALPFAFEPNSISASPRQPEAPPQ
jgi:hypothetical protein